MLTYPPGSKNRKADALSQSFTLVDPLPERQDPIIPSARIFASLFPQIAEQILNGQSSTPTG